MIMISIVTALGVITVDAFNVAQDRECVIARNVVVHDESIYCYAVWGMSATEINSQH